MALAAGIIRVAFWLAAFFICIYNKRIAGAALFFVVTTSSSVFLFSNAGLDVDPLLFDYAVLVSTPIAAVFAVAAFQAGRMTGGRTEKWQLW